MKSNEFGFLFIGTTYSYVRTCVERRCECLSAASPSLLLSLKKQLSKLRETTSNFQFTLSLEYCRFVHTSKNYRGTCAHGGLNLK